MNALTTDAPVVERTPDASAAQPVARVWRPPRKRRGAIALIVLLATGAMLALATALFGLCFVLRDRWRVRHLLLREALA